jgi:hypothetical protein
VRGRQVRDVAAEELHGARSRQVAAGDEPEERRLARAVRSQHRAPLALFDLELDARDGADAAEVLLELPRP